MIFVLDARVHLNALNPAEAGSGQSQTFGGSPPVPGPSGHPGPAAVRAAIARPARPHSGGSPGADGRR